jgi:Uma2 family endonuclease
MSVAPTPPPSGIWTAEEYDALPEDGYRRELVEGVLHVAASPTGLHQRVAGLIWAAMDARAPRDIVVTQAVEIKLNDRLRYIPDVLAVTIDGYAKGLRSQYLPRDVVLALEIVSDSSRGMDRVLKPNHYASVGIPHFWRVELEPDARVFTYELSLLGDEGYVQTGEHGGKVDITVPWPIAFDLDRLVSRDS